MYVVFKNARRSINLDSFDEIALRADDGKWYIVAKKYTFGVKSTCKTLCGDNSGETHADGVLVCYIKCFENSKREVAESLYDALQEAWINDDSVFEVE